MFAGDEAARLESLLGQVRRLAAAGIDVLQVREKDLPAAGLRELVLRLRAQVPASGLPRLLVNAGIGGELAVEEACAIALAAGGDGVHLPGGWSAESVARVQGAPGGRGRLVVSVTCHAIAEAGAAAAAGADLILFGPVFGKQVASREVAAGVGLGSLRGAVEAAAGTPVLALGGVTAATTAACLEAGAAGVAGIRLFAGL